MASPFVNPIAPYGQNPPSSTMSLPTTTVELFLRCANLKDKDIMSKSDPVAILFGKSRGQSEWRELWRSERINNDLNPSWKKTFTHEYRFEENQPIKVEIYDWDTDDKGVTKDLKSQELLGRLETTMAAIIAAPQKQFTAVLRSKSNKGAGTIFIQAEEITANKQSATFHFAAKDLDKKDTFGKSDPFMVISRLSSAINGKRTPTKVHTTDIIKNSLNPSWQTFTISLKDLCNGDPERPIQFDVYDWDSSGDNDLIGSFTATFVQLKMAVVEKTEFRCINPQKAAKKKGYKDSGKVFLKFVEVVEVSSFLDYIQGGTALNFSVAVDFTASNGHPLDPKSLHFLSQNGVNQYTQAIQAVGEIIEPYDADMQFPALGFGAKIPHSGEVSFEFFLNLSPNPFCNGVSGIMEAYKSALTQVTLWGPTNFSPVINHVAKFAHAYQDGKQYFVLLILTDGIITDYEDTKSAIVSASMLPMSIIIVGVGQEDFSAMEALDCDKGLLKAGGRSATRDIVQFVEMRKFAMSGGFWDREGLAREVLAEVPNQVVRWMTMRGLKPIHS